MTRRSVHANGYWHETEIPTASRLGPLLASSIIVGYEPGVREMPEDPERQAANVFRHVGAILEAGHATWDDVVKMTFWVASPDLRAVVEREWVAHFTEPDSRPARHTQVLDMRGAIKVRAEFLAYVDT